MHSFPERVNEGTSFPANEKYPCLNIFDSHHQLLDITHKTRENEMDLIQDNEYESKSDTNNMEAPPVMIKITMSAPRRSDAIAMHNIKYQNWDRFSRNALILMLNKGKELSRRTGLEPWQVKFWFQNKHTRMKSQHECHENTQLRIENEKLRAENIHYKETLSNATCPNYGGPATIGEMSFDEQHLRTENARLRE